MKTFLKTCWANLLGKEIILRLSFNSRVDGCRKSAEYIYETFAEAEDVKAKWLAASIEGETAEVFMR